MEAAASNCALRLPPSAKVAKVWVSKFRNEEEEVPPCPRFSSPSRRASFERDEDREGGVLLGLRWDDYARKQETFNFSHGFEVEALLISDHILPFCVHHL